MSRVDVSTHRPAAARAVRRAALGLALCGGLLLPAGAWAAPPTCLDTAGATVRCATAVASPASADDARQAEIPLPSPQILFGMICVIGGLFALIGLMPDFDGWGENDGRRKRD